MHDAVEILEVFARVVLDFFAFVPGEKALVDFMLGRLELFTVFALLSRRFWRD